MVGHCDVCVCMNIYIKKKKKKKNLPTYTHMAVLSLHCVECSACNHVVFVCICLHVVCVVKCVHLSVSDTSLYVCVTC